MGSSQITSSKTNHCRYPHTYKSIHFELHTQQFTIPKSVDSFLLARPSANERKRAARVERQKEKAATLVARRKLATSPRNTDVDAS
jgi:hypothetical protein